ncbi:OmpA family protein [Aquimarina pacifica]|uniref:OmpA family protein n=1 Tax=Aquimarina pacifica TaxID=1296415 RepID=UPI0004713341|nr:OmpA family protein [Aquimarina pacifica]
MKQIILFTSTLLICSLSLNAQKKKDLLDEIETLRTELKNTKSELSDARKTSKAKQGQIEGMEAQMNDLKETNTSLLTQMSSFTELSNKKAKNLETSLKNLQEKDKQLKVINDALTKSDSTKLATLTVFKNALGDSGSIGVKNGMVLITIPNTKLFGDNDKSIVIDEKGKGILSKIATALNGKSNLKLIVEGNSNALNLKDKTIKDNWALSSLQAAAIVSALQKDYKVNPKRLEVLAKSEYGTEGIETVTRLIIDPEFDQFYSLVKENMKNNSKQ